MTSTRRNNVAALLLVFSACVLGTSVYAAASQDRTPLGLVVVTGVYKCTGYGGLQHSIDFTATDLGSLHIETVLSNQDEGDCTPRGDAVRTVAESMGCTVGPLTVSQGTSNPFTGRAFGFVCKGTRSKVVNVIEALSQEILRSTTPVG
jgi:hypothetical protein